MKPTTRTLTILLCGAAAWSYARGATTTRELPHTPIHGASAVPLPSAGPATPTELAGFIDGFISLQLQSKPAAGAVVVVVKDGSLLFSKGYGYADVEERIPFDVERTTLRPGSVGKLFTWTAIMQLVEQGKLDLDADVNHYLKALKVPATRPEPVTLRNLMTHTAGFEEGYLGYLLAGSAKDYRPLGEFLPRHQPARGRPATTDFNDGTSAAYSNWGASLAGHIVEAVSGMPYDDYVEQHILEPLGMTSSTFREPLPPELAQRLSNGYEFRGGRLVPQPFEGFHNIAPAGSITTSAIDMTKFMLAHLQGGALGDRRILRPETVDMMHRRTLSPDPALNGMTLGFFETWLNGRRIVNHGGDTLHFHSMLALVPEEKLGLFVAFNTGGGAAAAAREFDRAFFKHYFSGRLPRIKPGADAIERNERYAGIYRDQRHSYTKIDKVLNAGGDLSVVAMPDGTLLFEDFFSGEPARWIEVGEGVFRNVADDSFVAFKGDRNGHPTHLVGPTAIQAAECMNWYDGMTFQGTLFVLASVLFISTLVSAIRQLRSDRAGAAALRWARPVLALAGLLLLVFAIGMVSLLGGDFIELATAIPSSFYVVLTIPLLALPLVSAAAYFTVIVWKGRKWSLFARVHYSAATFGALAFLWLLNYWNLIGYRFG